MIVKRATKEDLHQLAVLFDEYRQFYGASSNIEQSYQFLKHRFDNKDSVILSMLRMMCFYRLCSALSPFLCIVKPTIF